MHGLLLPPRAVRQPPTGRIPDFPIQLCSRRPLFRGDPFLSRRTDKSVNPKEGRRQRPRRSSAYRCSWRLPPKFALSKAAKAPAVDGQSPKNSSGESEVVTAGMEGSTAPWLYLACITGTECSDNTLAQGMGSRL